MSRRRSSTTSCRVATPGKVCCFCGLCDINELEYGKMYELGNIVTHYYCLLLSSMMQQKGRDDQGILGFLSADIEKEVKRGKRLACYHCKKIGATLGCCNTKCKRIFHLPCGLKAGSLHQFYSEFRSYCINHRPKQLIDGRVLEEVQNAETTLCYICYDNVNYRDILAMLWAPCCKKNAFFHRKCVQQLANSSGYFFKCPLCNNKKEFQEAMLEHGIFIPSQDASWELVPNAFHELLYRHNQCDAETCVCPKGRSHSGSNAKWELVLCQMCGSQGIHRHCGHLKWTTSFWECDDCRLILDKSSLVNRKNQSDSAAGNAGGRGISKDIDSDSDLSVGHDSHDQTEKCSTLDTNIPIVKVRPGPLSYKMKEVMKVAQSQPKTKGSSSSLEGTNSSSSLPNCENGNKNVKDPKTVILIDSDEEADVIEIISEKQRPKVLTTNDGKKIEILDKKAIDSLTINMERIDESSSSSSSSKLLSKDSKPIITSIQKVNKVLNQIPSLIPINNSNSTHENTESTENQIINNSQFRSKLTMSGSIVQETNQSMENFSPKVSLKSISQQYFTPRNSAPQIFHLRSIGPQALNQRMSNAADSMKLKSPAPIGLIPHSMIAQNSNFVVNTIEQCPMNSEISNNVPKISMNENDSLGIKILDVCSLAPDLFDKIESSVPCSSSNVAVESTLKRKAETQPGPSQYYDDAIKSDLKRTRLATKRDTPPLAYFNDWRDKLRGRGAIATVMENTNNNRTNTEMTREEFSNLIIRRNENLINEKGNNDLNKRKDDWRGTIEIWKETKELWKEKHVDFEDNEKRIKLKHPILQSLMEQAIGKTNMDNLSSDEVQQQQQQQQPSTSYVQKRMNSSPASNVTFYMERGKSQEVLKVGGNNGACQRDAVTSPTISPKLSLSTINCISKVGFQAENQITTKADSQIGNDSIEDFKFSGMHCSNSEGSHELYENSSSCDSTGLIPDNVSLSDVKFRVCGSDIVQVILYDKYRIDIKMDNSGSRSPRDSDSSPLPCPSFTDEFDDSQETGLELPRKRIRDFEFEENTLQEFPATSRDGNIINNTLSFNGMIAREISPKAAKENLNPIQSIIVDDNNENDNNHNNDNNGDSSTTFNDDLRILHNHSNNSANTRASGVNDTCINCKVSIDLKKIWDLVESQPHLFSKYDEPRCNSLKEHEINLTNVCKWKKKLLLMDNQSQDSFYDNIEANGQLCKNKSIINDDIVMNETNREEIQNCPNKSNLRRGLKRKCKYSTPIR